MPKYTYECDSCKSKKQLYKSINSTSIECGCGSVMNRLTPSITSPSVKETIDSYTNVQVDPDNRSILEERSSEHFWKVIVPRLCQEHPIDHCLREGWMYIDDKGHIQMHTKPPNRR